MSLSFASAVGNVMNRLGKAALLIKQVKAYQTAQLANLTDTTNGITAQFNAEPDVQAIPGSQYIGLLDGGGQTVGSVSQQTAKATMNRMIFRDNPRLNQTLTQNALVPSLREFLRQMKAAGATVLAQTVTATPTQFSGFATNIGNGIIALSTRRPFDGLVLENAFAENLLFTCSADSYSGGQRAGNEAFSVTGTGAQTNLFAFNWPLGSNASTGLNAIDGNSDNTSGNILTNSGFNDWTNDVPDNWELVTGTAGTNIAEETSIVYDGAASLQLIGDGVTATQIRQRFGISTGTSGELEAQTQYCWNAFLRRDGVIPAVGSLIVELVDSLGTVIKDANGVDNTFAIDLTGLTTSFVSYTGVFRLPIIMPATYYIRYRLATFLTAGRSVYIDKSALGEMAQAYVGGPFLAVFAGSSPFVVGDYCSAQISNSRGAAGTLSTWQTAFFQLFSPDWSANEFLLPSSSSPTVSDGLIG